MEKNLFPHRCSLIKNECVWEILLCFCAFTRICIIQAEFSLSSHKVPLTRTHTCGEIQFEIYGNFLFQHRNDNFYANIGRLFIIVCLKPALPRLGFDILPSHLHHHQHFWLPHHSIHNASRALSATCSWHHRWTHRLCCILFLIHRYQGLSIDVDSDGQRVDFCLLRNCFLAGNCICLLLAARNQGQDATGN